jgi:hypothetical protein
VILIFEKDENKKVLDYRNDLSNALKDSVSMSGSYPIFLEPIMLHSFKEELEKRINDIHNKLSSVTKSKDYHRILENYALSFAGFTLLAKSMRLSAQFRKNAKNIIRDYLVKQVESTVALGEKVSNTRVVWTAAEKVTYLVQMISSLTAHHGAGTQYINLFLIY